MKGTSILVVGLLGALAFILFGMTASAATFIGGDMLSAAIIALAQKYAQINSILNPEEIGAIILNESGGNPNATNPSDPSYGLMGVTPPIAQKFAGVSNPADILIPDNNVKAGSGYLAYLKDQYAAIYDINDPQNGWVQMYNLGEPKFLKGERVPSYQANYLAHLSQLGGQPQ